MQKEQPAVWQRRPQAEVDYLLWKRRKGQSLSNIELLHFIFNFFIFSLKYELSANFCYLVG
jgi:hypothetical protein